MQTNKQRDKRRIQRVLSNCKFRYTLNEIGIRYHERNDGLWFSCVYPQHEESKPSTKLTIDPYSEYCGVFHCFGCKRSGTIIDIVREKFHNEFWEAVLWLESRLNEEEIYCDYSDYHRKHRKKIKLPDEFQTHPFLEDWPKRFRNYIEKRNISWFQTLKYNIGYCDHGPYKNMVIIPITMGNRLVTWSGRHIRRKEHAGPEQGKVGLFGSNYLIKPKQYPAIIVEGWADKIKMENIGYDNVLSIQTNKLMSEQIDFIIEKGFPYMIVIPDNDNGGNVLVDSLGKYLEFIPIYIANIESKDPGAVEDEEEIHSAIKNMKEWEPSVEQKEMEIDYE